MHNLVHACVVLDRITAEEKLNIDIPEAQTIMDIPPSEFILDGDDMQGMKEEMAVIVQRMLVKHLSCFAYLDPGVLTHIPHKYRAESGTKDTVVRIIYMEHSFGFSSHLLPYCA